MKTALAILLFNVVAYSLCAQTNLFFEKLAVGQNVYSNCIVRKFNFDNAIVECAAGGAMIYFTNLPPDLQNRLGFNTTNITKTYKLQAKTMRLDNILELLREEQSAPSQKIISEAGSNPDDRHYLVGKIIQVLDNNMVLASLEKEDYREIEPLTVAIKNYPRATFDDAVMNVNAWSDGTYKYESVNNSVKTVLLFDCGETIKIDNSETISNLTVEVKKLENEIIQIRSEIRTNSP
jgi:hypothetical protein